MKPSTLFASVFAVAFIGILFIAPSVTIGQDSYIPLEKIPGAAGATTLPDYISGIYKFGIWTVGIAALFMLTVGGFVYMTSGGNTATLSRAKGYISDALIGLILALLAYLILNVINPDLVNLNLSKFGEAGGLVPSTGIQAPSAAGLPAQYTSAQCYNKPVPNGLYASNAASCPEGTSSIGNFVNDSGVVNGVCCAPKLSASMCPPSSIKCSACAGCAKIPAAVPIKTASPGACYGGNCFLNSNLSGRIQKVSIQGWQVTEAWPPTVNHLSICHQNGTCADLNNSGGPTDPVTIKKYYDAFNAAGLKTLYESKNCAPYVAAGVTNCASYPTMVGLSSFHVK